MARTLEVTCPAGERIVGGGSVPSCYCNVEHHLIEGDLNPRSLARYCYGDFTACSTWRSEKERIWARERELVEGED